MPVQTGTFVSFSYPIFILMEFSTGEIAALLGGTLTGDASVKINSLAKIADAAPGSIAFLSNPKYEQFIYATAASAVIVQQSFVPKAPVNTVLIKVADPYTAFTVLLEQYARLVKFAKKGIEQPSHIGEGSSTGESVYRGAFSYIGNNTVIGNNVKVYPQVYIGDNVTIGNNTILYAGVRVLDRTVIGNNCTIQAGCVIGSDGFGFAPQPDGSYKTIPQVGNVILEDNVDIGANTVIDCATMGSTVIKTGVKLDNLIQVAHNAEIGSHTVIAAQAGVSGSSVIGAYCMIGGQAGISGHIKIADKTNLGAQTGVASSITESGKTFLGAPQLEIRDFMRSYVLFKKLPELAKRLAALEEGKK